ncbi:MAG TPA: hypothetical protein HA254_04355 [Candidatus Diapherotrites archaeon]|uniref:Uncharacterized protein n=1 Tax=Candidatus Iainarchaeum sp. TaxID=3101447 RepID=A0A7J4J0G7_9ARCH|nr:hypothetical protein [Candidatus Diapherotrites archaeon]
MPMRGVTAQKRKRTTRQTKKSAKRKGVIAEVAKRIASIRRAKRGRGGAKSRKR